MTSQRREQIAVWVREHGAARVGELAGRFQVSAVTIRHDLALLEKEGRLLRDRGGAIASLPCREINSLLAVEKRAHLHKKEKQRIAHAASKLVEPGDTILMDAGTTAVEMTPHLAHIERLTVVTYALNVALEVGAGTEARVILLGGTYNRESSSVLGPFAEQTLGQLRVDKLFLGTQAFDLDHGLTDTTIEIAQIKRNLIRAARQVILLTDALKWATVGFIRVAPLNAVHRIITDTRLPAEAQAIIQKQGIDLTLV